MNLIKENNIRNRFVKDYSLPIKLVREVSIGDDKIDSFEYYIEHLSEYYPTKEAFNKLKDYLNKFNDSEEFFTQNANVVCEVQRSIMSTEGFLRFKKDISRYENDFNKININKNKYLLRENDGKEFISIDLREANFQALSFFDEDIISKKPNFKSFIKEFTDSEYIINSKRIRQIIFGDNSMYPKGQQRIQRYIISNVMKTLLSQGFIKEGVPVEMTSDEIIICKDFLEKDINSFVEFLPKGFSNIRFRIEKFSIERLNTRDKVKQDIFLKKEDGKVSIKNCPAIYVPEVVTFLKSDRDVNVYKNSLHFLDRLGYENGRVYSYYDYLFC